MIDLWNGIRLGLVLAVVLSQSVLGSGSQSGTTQDRIKEESHALERISLVLEKDNRLGILEYKAKCVDSGLVGGPMQLHEDTEKSTDAVVRLKHLLSHNSRFQIRANVNDVIMIREAGVADDVLNVRFSQVTFSSYQQVDPNQAIDAILSSKEVAAYFKENHISTAPKWGGFEAIPRPGLPKLQSEMKNMTVLEAIRQILITFPHLAAYKVCTNERGDRIISIEFL